MASSEEYFRKKIIVIGAGMSGLACASSLRDYGFENVLILEARDRIGGRINTVHDEKKDPLKESGDRFVEFGAEWIHGKDGNIIFELAHSKGLVDESAFNYFESLTNFKQLFPEEDAETINLLIKFLEEKAEATSENMEEDISFSDFLDQAFAEYLADFGHADDKRKQDFLKAAYYWFRRLQCELIGCTSLSSVSTRLLNQYEACEGDQTVQLKYGYSSVLNLMYEKIPRDTILLNSIVEKVDWTDFKTDKFHDDEKGKKFCNCKCNTDLKVKVFCMDGKIYEADHVIITIPLGCLKTEVDSLFVPPVSEDKIRAIKAVGFETVNKIFFEFDRPFWKPPKIYHVMTHKFAEEPWTNCINRFAYTPGHRKMLCGWVVGPGAIAMEELSDEEVSSQCMEFFTMYNKRFYSKNDPPTIKRMLRSKWHSDPYARGSYSYLSMDCDKNSILEIAKPEVSNVFCDQHPVLQFAGEATHPHHFSSVHGAYESGIREAKRIIDHYRRSVSNNILEKFETQVNLYPQNLLHEDLKILIIGAGISGLAAAFSLYKKGFRRISILEAQNKIGGRIFSLDLDHNILELGAQWLHGTTNPLYDFSLSNDLLNDESSYEGQGLFCNSNGEIIDTKIVQEVKTVIEGIKLNLLEGKYKFLACSSVQSIFLQAFDSYFPTGHKDTLHSVRKSLLNWFLKFEIIDNACDNLDEVAVQGYSEWCDIPDEEYHINFKHGFTSVVNAINSQLPTDYLQLKKPVKTINWQKKLVLPHKKTFLQALMSDNFPVSVECEDGEDITANIVILTASVGYIKENLNTFFKPPLPDKKCKAFDNVGFGTINKIFLIYKSPFWGAQDQGFQLVWTENLDDELKILLKEHPWINGITGFDVVQKQSNVLLGWIGGAEARLIESIDTEVIGSVCIKLLRTFLNSHDIPYPDKTIRTCWSSNPYIRGAYSFRSVKFYESFSKLSDLQCPLHTVYEMEDGKKIQWPVVCFAGEAMDTNCFSSVHGAFQSGLKIADDIDLICSQKEESTSGEQNLFEKWEKHN